MQTSWTKWKWKHWRLVGDTGYLSYTTLKSFKKYTHFSSLLTRCILSKMSSYLLAEFFFVASSVGQKSRFVHSRKSFLFSFFCVCTSQDRGSRSLPGKEEVCFFCFRVSLSQKTLWPACVRALPHNDTLFRGSANIDGGGRHKVGQHYNRNNERRLRSKISRQGVIRPTPSKYRKSNRPTLATKWKKKGLEQKCWIRIYFTERNLWSREGVGGINKHIK